MALDGMAAVQARIAQIQQMFDTPAVAPAQSAPSTNTDFASALANASDSGSATTAPTSGTNGSSQLAQQFLQTALAEKGKPYVYGATANTNDPNPPAFDCSELTKWAAARVGVTIPDGATAQYLYTRDHGTTMSVDQALHTPGALLFHFGHEPKNLGDIPADGHVAISLGDGVHTIEARGHKYGTNVFDASGLRAGFFNFAGMIPGM
jgi:cell wall-associated NlpC family hydrolase